MTASTSPVAAPVVSVVVPAYNGAGVIEETLASLSAQTFDAFEVIVVDDGSADTTREIVGTWPDPRVRLLAMTRNGGPVLARNRGVGEARGRYIAALDQDDLCRPDRLRQQVAYLDAHPDIVLVGTNVDFLRDGRVGRSSYAKVTTPALLAWLTAFENPLAWSSVMLRADAARALTPFSRQDRIYAEDFDLYQRIRALGGIARIDEPLVIYRQHEGGISRRYVDTMRASATAVLTERHAALFGDAAGAIAELLVRHVMERQPMPDRASLHKLGQAIGTMQAEFIATYDCDAQSLALIRSETIQRWRRITRSSLRAGTLTVADVLAVRPDRFPIGQVRVASLVWERAIGIARRTMRASG